MEIGYTVWTWMQDEFGRRDNPTDKAEVNFEQALKEISHLGYKKVENFNFIVPVYEKCPEKLRELLAKYGLELVNLYHTYFDSADEWLSLGERTCKLLSACGAKFMNIQGSLWRDEPFERSLNKEGLDYYCKVFTKMGQISQKYGITTCVHPHANTLIFHEDEIDYFLDHTDREYISLTMDTAHTALAGMDDEKAFDKYGEFIKYVHMKDLDPDKNAHPEWPMKRFVALGQGFVDFKGVIRSLKKHNYDGILCVEVDYPLVCNYETAQFSRNYIKDVLGM